MSHSVKITVIRKYRTEDIYSNKESAPIKLNEDFQTSCPFLEVGDEFIVNDIYSCPSGFCARAFADIDRDLTLLHFGGDFPWSKEKGKAVSCCTEGLRPVFFLLERL